MRSAAHRVGGLPVSTPPRARDAPTCGTLILRRKPSAPAWPVDEPPCNRVEVRKTWFAHSIAVARVYGDVLEALHATLRQRQVSSGCVLEEPPRRWARPGPPFSRTRCHQDRPPFPRLISVLDQYGTSPGIGTGTEDPPGPSRDVSPSREGPVQRHPPTPPIALDRARRGRWCNVCGSVWTVVEELRSRKLRRAKRGSAWAVVAGPLPGRRADRPVGSPAPPAARDSALALALSPAADDALGRPAHAVNFEIANAVPPSGQSRLAPERPGIHGR
jgi:hypothetical protein